jgi:LysM repeat protein
MSPRTLLILTALLLATMACSFSSREPAQPTTTPIVSVASPTFIVPPTSTPVVTNTPAPSATPTRGSGSNTPCFVRTDWQIYIVQAGDTVSNIAARVGTNATALALANCLSNANSIIVGQALRVPVLPPPTATRTPIPNTATLPPLPTEPVGYAVVSDFISGETGSFVLLRGETITVTWVDHPTNMANATFYIAPYGVSDPYAAQYVVGYDDNPVDGLFISYRVHAGLNGHLLLARGLIVGGSGLASRVSHITPVSSAPSPELGCFMSASTDQGVPIYRYNDPNSQLVGTLTRDVQVQIMGRAVNGWYAFDPGDAANRGSSFLNWIPLGSALSFSGTC